VVTEGDGEEFRFPRAALDLAAEAGGLGADVVLADGRDDGQAAVRFHPSAALDGMAG